MTDSGSEKVRETIDALYRSDSRRVLATLIRLLGDFDLAEEALHDAFAAAIERWPADGMPGHPCAWLVSAGRFRALDALRRPGALLQVRDLDRLAARPRPRGAGPRGRPRRGARGRPPPPRVHLLPPGPEARGPGGAHPSRGLRTHDRGDRARVPHDGAGRRAAHRPRES